VGCRTELFQMMWAVVLLSIPLGRAYQNPFTAAPPLRTSGVVACSVDLFNVALSDYNLVHRLNYTPPSCANNATQVVLRFRGAVKGVQFDRWGAVWVSGIELLRTTTPEPDAKGITWAVDKDVSEYISIFGRPGNATFQLPNLVNPTYTGVLYANVSLDFFQGAGTVAPSQDVRPLIDFSATSNPVNSMCLSGASNHTGIFSAQGKNIYRARLDVMASAHGCEEFWYTNLPDNFPGAQCGGGAFRELRVFIDGKLAGAALPFPVIYTGGVNPLLWRPLTGIESFDVLPYRFDLSPFVGVLNNGSHEISVSVVGNSNSGVWCLDPIIVLEEDPTSAPWTGSHPFFSGSSDPSTSVQQFNLTQGPALQTIGNHSLSFSGEINNGSHRLFHSVTVSLEAQNWNKLSGAGQVTSGTLQSQTVSITDAFWKPLESVSVQTSFPYTVFDYFTEDSDSFQLNATVQYGRQEKRDVLSGSQPFTMAWSNRISSSAVYNRSTAADRTVHFQGSGSVETFTISNSQSGTCYDRGVSSTNGNVLSDFNNDDSCTWPSGTNFCGQAPCASGASPDAIFFFPESFSSQESAPPESSVVTRRPQDRLRLPVSVDRPFVLHV